MLKFLCAAESRHQRCSTGKPHVTSVSHTKASMSEGGGKGGKGGGSSSCDTKTAALCKQKRRKERETFRHTRTPLRIGNTEVCGEAFMDPPYLHRGKAGRTFSYLSVHQTCNPISGYGMHMTKSKWAPPLCH
jgi:hypothetical protein